MLSGFLCNSLCLQSYFIQNAHANRRALYCSLRLASRISRCSPVSRALRCLSGFRLVRSLSSLSWLSFSSIFKMQIYFTECTRVLRMRYTIGWLMTHKQTYRQTQLAFTSPVRGSLRSPQPVRHSVSSKIYCLYRKSTSSNRNYVQTKVFELLIVNIHSL